MSSVIPPVVHDPARLDALAAYAILDTPAEQGFDDIVQLAAQLCDVPVALVSLVAEDRQWFKAKRGFALCSTDLNSSVCAHALVEPDLLVIPDLTADVRTSANPLVTGDPAIRFYAGAPLRTPDGQVLGSLCVIDAKTRPEGLTPAQAGGLRALARQVMSQMEMRRALASRDALLVEQQAAIRDREAYRQTQAAITEAGGDIDAILGVLLAGAMQAVPSAEAGVIELIDGQELEYRAVRGTIVAQRGLRVPLAGSLSGSCALGNAPILVPDVLVDPRVKRDLVERLDLRSAVLAPVSKGGRVIGVLRLQSSKVDAFKARDLEMARVFAGIVTAGLTEARAVAALQAVTVAETRYRAIFESAIDFAMIATDRDGFVTDWNIGATRVLGWTADEMRGQSAVRFFTPEDQASGQFEREMRLSLDQGRANDERWHIRKDETRFWATGEMMPLRDGETLLGFLKILRDRTVAREAGLRASQIEQALVRSEERQRLAVDATGIGIFDFLPESGELNWDSRVRALFGVGPEDEVTYESCFLAGLHPDDRAATDAAVQAALAPDGPGAFDIAYRVRPLDGAQERWLAARGQSIFEEGRVVRFVGTVRDITAHKAAILDLVTAQERYRLATRATNDAIWDWDLTRNHVLWNEALTVAYGHDLAAVKPSGDWWLGHIHPDDRVRISQSIHDIIDRDGTTWTDRYRFLCADGSYADVIDRGFVIRDAVGQATRMVGAMLDVTKINAAERWQAALVAFGDRTRDLTDPDEIVFAACALLGTTLDADLVGYGLVDPKAETIVMGRDWTAPGVGSLEGTLHFRDYGSYIEELKSGETVVIADASTDLRTRESAEALKAINAQAFVNMPLFEQGGFVALLYVLQGDARIWSDGELALIREMGTRARVAAERARSEKERRRQALKLASLNATLEQQVADRTRERDRIWRLSTDLMLVTRFDAIIVAVNPAWTNLLDWTEDQLIGRSFMDFVHPEDAESTSRAAGDLSSGAAIPRFENRYRHKDGSYRWLSWTAVPDQQFIHAIARDFTAEKEQAIVLARTEEALRQSQKMEAVGQLTGGIAHDFNNLLTGITGSLELLETRIAQGRLNDVQRYTMAAQGAAKRAAALTHRLLAFSRQQTLDPKTTDVNRLVAGMEDLVRRTVGPAIAIDVVAAVGLWPTLIDPPQLENALLNLCINARDAMAAGGRITIETANRWLDKRAAEERDLEPGQYISLCVSDTGTGMSPDIIAKAFDPFFTTKPIGQGTGLGLSMIYGFVRQSGGQVRIYSEVGQGTNVCLYLPRHVGQADVPEDVRDLTDAPRALAGETVLVVDDEPTVRMLVTEVLEELGYAAIEASDGFSGLKVLQSDVRIDLLVTDVGLPGGMNGRQMVDKARESRPRLEVLFITGFAENAVLSGGHLDPGMHVMTKPFAMEALAARIKELIAGG